MAASMIEQIAVAILAALQDLVTSGAASFAERPGRLGVLTAPRDKALYLYQDDPEKDDEAPHGFIQWLQPFLVACVVVPSEDAAGAVDTEINELRSQVEMKLREDPTWGLPGCAIDTTIEAPIMFTEQAGGFSGAVVVGVVRYRTREDDPYGYT